MKPGPPLTVLVRHADGRDQRLHVESQSALIGSAAHCEVRLPLDQAAGEHVLLLREGESVTAEARCSSPAPTLDGTPLRVARLDVGSVLALAETRIYVSLAKSTAGRTARETRRKWAVRTVLALIAAAGALGLGKIGVGADPALPTATAPSPPPLWSATLRVCRAPNAAEAFRRAERLAARAHAKHLRGPFSFTDAGFGVME